MAKGKFDIYVFADWFWLKEPTLIGILSAHFAKAKKDPGYSIPPSETHTLCTFTVQSLPPRDPRVAGKNSA